MFFFVWLLGSGLPMAVSPVIAHVQGEHAAAAKPRDRREVRAAARMGLWSVALIVAAAAGCSVLHPRHPAVAAARNRGWRRMRRASYRGAGLGLPFALGFQVLRSFSTALSPRRAAAGGDGRWRSCSTRWAIIP